MKDMDLKETSEQKPDYAIVKYICKLTEGAPEIIAKSKEILPRGVAICLHSPPRCQWRQKQKTLPNTSWLMRYKELLTSSVCFPFHFPKWTQWEYSGSYLHSIHLACHNPSEVPLERESSCCCSCTVTMFGLRTPPSTRYLGRRRGQGGRAIKELQEQLLKIFSNR